MRLETCHALIFAFSWTHKDLLLHGAKAQFKPLSLLIIFKFTFKLIPMRLNDHDPYAQCKI